MFGSSLTPQSLILAFSFDIGCAIGGPFVVSVDQHGIDQVLERILVRNHPDLGIAAHAPEAHLFIPGIKDQMLDLAQGTIASGGQFDIEQFGNPADPLTGS